MCPSLKKSFETCRVLTDGRKKREKENTRKVAFGKGEIDVTFQLLTNGRSLAVQIIIDSTQQTPHINNTSLIAQKKFGAIINAWFFSLLLSPSLSWYLTPSAEKGLIFLKKGERQKLFLAPPFLTAGGGLGSFFLHADPTFPIPFLTEIEARYLFLSFPWELGRSARCKRKRRKRRAWTIMMIWLLSFSRK